MAELIAKQTARGISITHRRRQYRLNYPAGIWPAYPRKARDVLTDNLAHLLTINLPFTAGFDGLGYNTAEPMLKPLFDSMVVGGIPGAVESYADSTAERIRQFLNTSYTFWSNIAKRETFRRSTRERAIVTVSCGKDSLLSLAVCRELGLDPVPVYINDTISPSENGLKLRHSKRLAREFGLDFQIMANEVEQLNDFRNWDSNETCLGYMHMMTGFCLISLPIAHYFKARYIVVGNQQNMNFGFMNRDGYWTWPSFDQTSYWTRQQDRMVQMLSGGAMNVVSVIEPLTNIAIMDLLCNRYPDFTKYLVSCDSLDASDEPRWCHGCNECARLQMMIHAVGGDPRTAGYHHDLLQLRHRKFYRIFDGREVDSYEKSDEARDEQLLAFLMAWKNGTRGPLMSRFERDLLPEAKSREGELRRRFLAVHEPTTAPPRLRRRLLGLYGRVLPT